jgi:hypothetical protein
MRLARIVLCCLVATACHAAIEDPPPAAPPPALATAIAAAQQRMHLRYTAARTLTEAIARSDLELADAHATSLAELDEPDALPAWRPYVLAVQRGARDVLAAANLPAAARAAASLGRRCASCHVAIRARVAFASEPRPDEPGRLAQEMLRHQWAANQLWQGVIAPSDERWNAGAEALLTAPLGTVAQHGIAGFEDDLDDLARVRLFARRALAAGDADTRATLYGDLLATCAHCHAILRDR